MRGAKLARMPSDFRTDQFSLVGTRRAKGKTHSAGTGGGLCKGMRERESGDLCKEGRL